MRAFALALILSICGGAAVAQQPARWRLVEEWRKGGETDDGPYQFDYVLLTRRIQIVQAGLDGRLIILDATASRVHVVDSTGKLVRSFGGRGAGPGELRGAKGVAIAPDGRIVISDASNGRLSIFSRDGVFERTVPVTRVPAFAFDIPWDASFDRTGRLSTSIGARGAATNSAARSGGPPDWATALSTERWQPGFGRSDTAAACGAPPPLMQNSAQFYVLVNRTVELEDGKAPRSIGGMPIPFAEQRPYFVRDRDGFEWAPRAMGSGELVRRESGRCDAVLARITLRGPRAPIPSALRSKAIESEKVPADVRGRVPREYPWFHSLRVDDRNRLWVERDVAGGKRFDVFTSGGQAVAEIDAPRALVIDLPYVIAHDRLYGFVRNEDDVPFLVAWRIAR